MPAKYAERGLLPFAAVEFPDFSVDRGKHAARWEDAAKGNPDWGVATFKVRDIPGSIPHPEEASMEYRFRPEDDPLPNNPAHAHVRSYRAQGDKEIALGDKGKNVASCVKKRFRAELVPRMEILREMNGSTT